MIGKKLKHLLKANERRQIDLAKHLGISPSRLSNYLSDKREPDFEMLSEMAYFLGVDMNYFADRDFNKKRKDVIFEVAEPEYTYGNERESMVKVPLAPINGKKKGISSTLIPVSGLFLLGTKNPEDNVMVFAVNSDVPADIASEDDYLICIKCVVAPLRDGDMIFENGRNMKFYRFYRDSDIVMLISLDNNKEHIRIKSIHDLDGFYKINWVMKKY